MRGRRSRRARLACTSAFLLGLGAACSENTDQGQIPWTGPTGSGPLPSPAGSGGSVTSPNTIAAPADNVAAVAVDFGLPGIPYLDGLFATVTVCVPGTSNCQNIDHVLVDTGSSGLRLLKSVLTLALPQATNDGGAALAECSQFVSGFAWGPLATADFRIAGEQASNLTIQVINEQAFPVPNDCTGTGVNTAQDLGCNGILGIGSFLQDCGSDCQAPLGVRSTNPGTYYACSSTTRGGCQATVVPVAKQVSNPVALFSQDNNGTIIELPAIPANGARQVAGALVFGIGTRENNGLDQATVMPLSSQEGTFLTSYPPKGNPSLAFVDSGSNAIYFLDSGFTRIPTCPGDYSVFYCPTSTLNLSAMNQDDSGRVSVTVNFSVASAMTLLASGTNCAFSNVGGPSVDPSEGTASMGVYFDWGLPFHFGRNVFNALEGQATPVGPGPFVAF
jgi:Protein of unknown function (DUF3443)